MDRVPRRFRDSIWSRLGLIGVAGGHADRVLDTTQEVAFRILWLFIPEPSIARDGQFQHLLVSRLLSEAGQQTLAFAAIVAVAREGGSALEVAVIGVAALVPPAVFGLYGGVVADALPKRIALAGAYTGQALLCFALPTFLDTSNLATVVALILAVNLLGQVSAPTESSVLPLVANEEQLASAASLINLAAAAGQGFAAALFAPVLVRVFGVDAAFYLAGLLLTGAASRTFDLPVGAGAWQRRLPPMRVRLRFAVRWLVTHPSVGTMIILSVLAGTVNVVLITLAPRYVEAVLHTDAANTAYVFAPSAVGLVLALLSAPTLIRRGSERIVAIAGMLLAGLSLTLLGVIDSVAAVADPVNPMHAAGALGLDLNERVRTAGLLAVPLAFGVALSTTSVQTYINRRVPLRHQSRTFALQNALRNGAAIFPLLTLGAAAGAFGADTVLLASPLLLLAIAYALVYASFRLSGLRTPGGLDVLDSFWEEPPEREKRQPAPGETPL